MTAVSDTKNSEEPSLEGEISREAVVAIMDNTSRKGYGVAGWLAAAGLALAALAAGMEGSNTISSFFAVVCCSLAVGQALGVYGSKLQNLDGLGGESSQTDPARSR